MQPQYYNKSQNYCFIRFLPSPITSIANTAISEKPGVDSGFPSVVVGVIVVVVDSAVVVVVDVDPHAGV